MPTYDTHTRSVVVWPQTEVCSRGVRCGSRVCASNHCARCVRAHGVHVHRMHVLLTDERNHARDSDRENEMPEASIAPWPRAVAVGVCHCVHRRLPTCSPPPIQGGLSLARAVSRSLARSRSLAVRAHSLLTVFLIDKHISQRERERERARARERERDTDTHTHTHTCTLRRTHTSQRSMTGYDRARKGLVAGELWGRRGGKKGKHAD